MANAVVWFEVSGPDPEGTSKFYSELFGWHTEAVPGGEAYIAADTHAGKGINGGFAKSQDGQPPSVTFYAEADDLQATLDKAESLGASTVVPVTEVPGIVTFAIFADPQGAAVGVLKGVTSPEEATGPSSGDNPQVGWFEIVCAEPEKAWDFYRELFDWDVKGSSGEGMVYGEVHAPEGQGISGGIGSTPDGQPHVSVYAEVDDLQKYVERAESLGGTTIMPPMDVGEGTSVAMIGDPQGTWFGLYRSEAR
jgi:predicted enzyme related to lactoylglutathione lyase